MDDVRLEGWTLIFVRELPQPREAVWAALTDPGELDQWAPYTAHSDLGTPGEATLIMVDGSSRADLPITVLTADEPAVLEHTWGPDRLRWELHERDGGGTTLTLRHTLSDRDQAAMIAAGWHLCLDVQGHLLDGQPVGVIRGRDALEHGWERLRDAYEKGLKSAG